MHSSPHSEACFLIFPFDMIRIFNELEKPTYPLAVSWMGNISGANMHWRILK